MTLYEFADVIGAHIELTRYANQSGRWAAKFERCEVADGGLLIGVYGNANDPVDAMADYAEKIKGQRLVFDAMRKERREFNAPSEFSE